jgi:GDP-mannose 6-dehydrogenase
MLPVNCHKNATRREERYPTLEEGQNMDVSIFGAGYVGAVSAACLARDGHRVTLVDVISNKVRSLNSGLAPVIEPGLAPLIQHNVKEGRLSATRSASKAINSTELSLICVGTPSTRNGSLDMIHLERVTSQIGVALRGKNSFHSVVYRSTVVPGTIEDIIIPQLEKISGKKSGREFGVGYLPEFLREGTAIQDHDNPGIAVFGAHDPITTDRIAQLVGGARTLPSRIDIRTAEAVKYVSNSWHAVKISFANEIGNICRSMGIDSHVVMEIFCHDKKLNISPAYLRPGFSFGGSCLPKDLRAIRFAAHRHDIQTPLLDAVLTANEIQLANAYNMIAYCGKRRIGILGLSFKPCTDDLRESPLVELAERLHGRGFSIKIYDPNIQPGRLTGSNLAYIRERIPHIASMLCKSINEVAEYGDVVVVGNAELGRECLPLLKGDKHIVDLVRVDQQMTSAGLYYGICW